MLIRYFIITALACATLVFFSSCGPRESGEGAERDIEQDWNISIELPPGWPDDVPIMDGFTIVASSAIPDTPIEKQQFFLVAAGNVDPYEAGQFYANLSGWQTNAVRFSDDPGLIEQFGNVGMAVTCVRDHRSLIVIFEVVTDGPMHDELRDLGCQAGQTAMTISHTEEIPTETV